MKMHLIIGGTGQDGRYLAKISRKFDMKVIVTTRKLTPINTEILEGSDDNIKLVELDPLNLSEVDDLISWYRPEHISNLTAQSSVGRSFKDPFDTYRSCVLPNLNILETLRKYSLKSKYFHASSGDCFGGNVYNSDLRIPYTAPQSPYASAKVAASECVSQYREHFDVLGFSGFLFNHESAFRTDDFVFPKIFKAAIKISSGEQQRLVLGNLDIVRDWGSAEEFMQGVLNYSLSDHVDDFMLGTGVPMSLRGVVDRVFSNYNLDYRNFVESDQSLLRTSEIEKICGTTDFLNSRIGWTPTLFGNELIDKLQTDFERKLNAEVL